MLKLGLTGGIATGKSTVANYFRELGITVIDADQIARKVVEPGMPALVDIKNEFGPDILLPNGELDRQKLGQIVFSDPAKLNMLNHFTHPRVHTMMQELSEEAQKQGAKAIVYEVPLLLETGNAMGAEKIIVVTVPPAMQLQRLMERDGLSQDGANKRINAQMPMSKKEELADYVISNAGSIEETKQQVDAILHALQLKNS
ncbi:MAG: dephospho-CoA kinase [Lactobacillaceae bacterium]|jgi:dephospho-CoA kinase|nr:dephospho-CoA kinase [Lactobacillaceae bacterium]